MKMILALVACLFMMSASTVWAIECKSDMNCDGKVNASDLGIYKLDYGKINCDPCKCNPIYECPTGQVECGGTCIDPDTDEDYCGTCSNSCASGEVCFAGTCYTGGVVIQFQAAVPKTGQTICYDSSGGIIPCSGTGQDGDLQRGVA